MLLMSLVQTILYVFTRMWFFEHFLCRYKILLGKIVFSYIFAIVLIRILKNICRNLKKKKSIIMTVRTQNSVHMITVITCLTIGMAFAITECNYFNNYKN